MFPLTAPALGDCKFDLEPFSSVCGWSQSTDDDADWIQGQSTPNANTGPSVDHLGSANGRLENEDSFKICIRRLSIQSSLKLEEALEN